MVKATSVLHVDFIGNVCDCSTIIDDCYKQENTVKDIITDFNQSKHDGYAIVINSSGNYGPEQIHIYEQLDGYIMTKLF